MRYEISESCAVGPNLTVLPMNLITAVVGICAELKRIGFDPFSGHWSYSAGGGRGTVHWDLGDDDAP